MKIISLALLLSSVVIHHSSFAATPAFRAGAAVTDITPTKFPVRVNAMFTERSAQQAVDRLYARSIALDDGSTQLVMCVVDTCMMARDLIDEAKKIAAKTTGLSAERMIQSVRRRPIRSQG